MAGGVAIERLEAIGGIVVARSVAIERLRTCGRVIGTAGGIVERIKTKRCVVDAVGRDAKKRVSAFSSVVVGIAAVRCRAQLRLRRRRQYEAGDHERDEQQTKP